MDDGMRFVPPEILAPYAGEIGTVEGVGLYRSGERESPQAAELREAMKPVYGRDGRLKGLVPKS